MPGWKFLAGLLWVCASYFSASSPYCQTNLFLCWILSEVMEKSPAITESGWERCKDVFCQKLGHFEICAGICLSQIFPIWSSSVAIKSKTNFVNLNVSAIIQTHIRLSDRLLTSDYLHINYIIWNSRTWWTLSEVFIIDVLSSTFECFMPIKYLNHGQTILSTAFL